MLPNILQLIIPTLIVVCFNKNNPVARWKSSEHSHSGPRAHSFAGPGAHSFAGFSWGQRRGGGNPGPPPNAGGGPNLACPPNEPVSPLYNTRLLCEANCNTTGFYCAQRMNAPFRFYCTDGTSPSTEVRRCRQYYVQIEEIVWDYLPWGYNRFDNNDAYLQDSLIQNASRVGSIFWKLIYRRYTDGYYDTPVPMDDLSWGFPGVVYKGEAGDDIIVHVRNNCNYTVSGGHPHADKYDKFSEAALYVDGTSGAAKADDIMLPGDQITLRWFLAYEFAPRNDDPNCLLFAVHGHMRPEAEIHSGLFAALVFCKPGTLGPGGVRTDGVDREHFLFADSLDEGESLLRDVNFQRCGNVTQCQALWTLRDDAFLESLKKDSIANYMYANGPPFQVCQGERVVWYIYSLIAELHAVEIHGHTLDLQYKRTSIVGLFPAVFIVAEMVSTKPGFWLISCRNSEHNRNGMHAYMEVLSTCGTVSPPEVLDGVERLYYLRAEVNLWNYAPSGQNLYSGGSLIDVGTVSADHYTADATHIGPEYLKARFIEYTDGNFTTAKTPTAAEAHRHILGPLIRAQVGDWITVVLQNDCPFNVSIYLQGVSLDKAQDGLWEKRTGTTMTGKIVVTNDTVTYTFTVPQSVSPGVDDPACLPYLYYSAINQEPDQNAGLVGPVLICKRDQIDPLTGIQKDVDKEFILMFADFDENLSWLLDDNIANANVTIDPSFEESNMMRSINGRAYGNLDGLEMCKGDKVVWHLLGLGGNEALHVPVFNGNNLRIYGINRDSHVLIPEMTWTGMMVADNVGNWSLACGTAEHFEMGEQALYNVGLCGAAPEPGYTPGEVTRTFWIAADTHFWDYAPSTIHPQNGEDYALPTSEQYIRVRSDPGYLGKVYMKGVYKEYTDGTFTVEKPRPPFVGCMGPILHVQVGDLVKVVFKNNAPFPLSIHAQGLRTLKYYEGYNYQDGNSSAGDVVQPGETFTYYWEVPESSGPTETGPTCQGSIYHSAVDPIKDIYSGFIGTLAICKRGTLDANNTRFDRRKEFPLLMMAWNENLSHYFQMNVNNSGGVISNDTATFEESNMYDSISCYIFANLPGLVMNLYETVAWYVLGMGGIEDMHPDHLHGNMFIHRTTRQHIDDVIAVFPHTYETVEMFTINPGIFLMHCHFGLHVHHGMSAVYEVLNATLV